MVRDIRIHVWRSYQCWEGVETQMCWLPNVVVGTQETHMPQTKREVKPRAILISKVLVKSEWVWQRVIDPVAPVIQSYPGVISIHQTCLWNILGVFWPTRPHQNNNSLTHAAPAAWLRATIVACVELSWTRVKFKHFLFTHRVSSGREISFLPLTSKVLLI